MATIEQDGSQTAVIGTEHTLFTVATGYAARVLTVDVSAMIAGDVLELRVSSPVRSGGTVQLIKLLPFTGAQTEPNAQSFPFLTHPTATFTLKQTAGTGRAFPWAVSTL